ncbi:uncharacterized protein LOC116652448 [Coturnix japonica]|uniref:uncharacterized protein LOC116652448 n=1 Tax=Coturnix japonica TaxID=93934 RepID=UPI0013A5F186|nr:uncharacterized protein LOC116652448 [Coturnix japonica]
MCARSPVWCSFARKAGWRECCCELAALLQHGERATQWESHEGMLGAPLGAAQAGEPSGSQCGTCAASGATECLHSMWHPFLPPLCVAAVLLCLQQAGDGCANSSGPGGPAPTTHPGLPLAEANMADSPTAGHASAHSPQCHRAEASPCAGQGGCTASTDSQGCMDVARGDEKGEGGPVVPFIVEVGAWFWRKDGQTEQRAAVLQAECCSWSHAVGSPSYCTSRCLTCSLDLLYYSLILPACKATIFLVAILAGTRLLAGCMEWYRSWMRSKEQSEEGQLAFPPIRLWGAAEHPQCAICLRAYKPHQALKLLSCSHAYHSKCIDLWHCTQHGSKTCPLCRCRVTAVALFPLQAHNSEQN